MIGKILLLGTVGLALTGCSSELQYEGNTRIVYEGHVVNRTGQPLANIPVNVMVSNTGDHDIISYGRTDESGDYVLVFPDPVNETNISVVINGNTPGSTANTTLSATEIYNIQWFNLADERAQLGTIYLYDVSNSVNLTIEPESVSGQGLAKLNVIGLVNNQMIDMNFSKPPHEDEHLSFIEQFQKHVSTNQTVTIRYQLNNGTTGEKQVQINDEDVHYVLEY